jgi:hypothetical protein
VGKTSKEGLYYLASEELLQQHKSENSYREFLPFPSAVRPNQYAAVWPNNFSQQTRPVRPFEIGLCFSCMAQKISPRFAVVRPQENRPLLLLYGLQNSASLVLLYGPANWPLLLPLLYGLVRPSCCCTAWLSTASLPTASSPSSSAKAPSSASQLNVSPSPLSSALYLFPFTLFPLRNFLEISGKFT